MACRLYSSVGPTQVDFSIHKEIGGDRDNNQINSESEAGDIESLEFGHASEWIMIRGINITASLLADVKSFLTDFKGSTFSYYEIQGVSSAVTVRWLETKFRWMKHHHDNYTFRLKLRVEKT